MGAGQDDFAALRDAWMREAEGFLLVYSITKQETFEEIQALYGRIMRVKEDDETEAPVVIVGNKCDLENQRQVPTKDGQALAAEYKCPFFETSAKTKICNTEPFFECARLIRDADGSSDADNMRDKKVHRMDVVPYCDMRN